MTAPLQLVAGELARPALELTGRLDDPDTGADLGPQRASDASSVERALACAAAAWTRDEWSDWDIKTRCAALERLAAAIDLRAEAIAAADCVDTGVPICVTSAIAASLGPAVRAAVSELRSAGQAAVLAAGRRRVELLRRPWGPAALLTPWNAPAPTAVGKVANALAAGCPAILKPSEHAPRATGEIAEAAIEAGLPPAALQVVQGGREVASALARDPRIRVVSLTGGAAAGKAVAAVAVPRMAALQLELGAANPAVVLDDADPDAAGRSLADGMTKLNGQWCEAPRRVLVAAPLHDALVDAIADRLAGLELGPARDRGTAVGPIAHRSHLARLRAQVHALGGSELVPAAEPPGEGLFFAPRVVTGLGAARVRDEIFGPVLTVHRVAGEGEAVAAANALGDGLAAYVFSGDPERAFAVGTRLRAGEVRLNGTHLADLAPGSEQSFWGTSGIGGHGARLGLEAFRGSRIVGEDDPEAPI